MLTVENCRINANQNIFWSHNGLPPQMIHTWLMSISFWAMNRAIRNPTYILYSVYRISVNKTLLFLLFARWIWLLRHLPTCCNTERIQYYHLVLPLNILSVPGIDRWRISKQNIMNLGRTYRVSNISDTFLGPDDQISMKYRHLYRISDQNVGPEQSDKSEVYCIVVVIIFFHYLGKASSRYLRTREDSARN